MQRRGSGLVHNVATESIKVANLSTSSAGIENGPMKHSSQTVVSATFKTLVRHPLNVPHLRQTVKTAVFKDSISVHCNKISVLLSPVTKFYTS